MSLAEESLSISQHNPYTEFLFTSISIVLHMSAYQQELINHTKTESEEIEKSSEPDSGVS